MISGYDYDYIHIYIDIYIYIYIHTHICTYYYTPLPFNLAGNNKQASKHFCFPFWPLLGLISPGSTVLWPSWSLADALAKSRF